MADEIEQLRAQISSLTRENSRLVAENTKRKATNRNLQSQVTTLTADLTTSNRDRDTYRSKAESNPSKDSEELESLRTQVRTYKHTSALAELAYSPDVGISRSVPADRIAKLIDYKAVSDEFDSKTTKKILLDLKDTDAYLFTEQPAGGSGQPKGQNNGGPLNPAVANLGQAFGRGSSPGPMDAQALSEEQLRNPVFMADWHRQQRMAENKK